MTGRDAARGTLLPQIWMTYEELAGMLDCSVMEARERVYLEGLDRKLSRDGRKRTKLNAVLIAIFIQRLKTLDVDMDQAVGEIRTFHGLLRDADRPRLTSWLRLNQTG